MATLHWGHQRGYFVWSLKGGSKKGSHPVILFFYLWRTFVFDADFTLENGGRSVKQNLLTFYYILYKYYFADTRYSDFMILVITGNGKGKTTSALGTAVRACGWGKKVAIAFFDKGGSHYGEEHALQFLQEKIKILRFGLERFDEASQTFRFENMEEDKQEAERALKAVRGLFNEHCFLIICDELINCMNLGLLPEGAVQELVEDCPEDTHLMLTGRNCPAWLHEKADLVSEVNEVKHYFKKEGGAVKGLDY